MHPTRAQFRDLARRGNLIPLWRETLLDLDTPVSAFLKIRGEQGGFLLESVEGGERWATYSFLGSAPRTRLRIEGDRVQTWRDQEIVGEVTAEDPLSVIGEILSARRPVGTESLPRFFGGAVGYLGYDFVRHWERLPSGAEADLEVPDGLLWLTDTLIVFDNLQHKARVIALAEVDGDPDAAYDAACARVEETLADLRRSLPPRPAGTGSVGEIRSNQERGAFEDAVRKAKEYVRAGDIIQVVLSQRFSTDAPGVEPFDVYRALRTLNPSPYMFYLRFPEATLVGASPEVLVRVEDGQVTVRPIAGTRPRGASAALDHELEEELRRDPKEIAEHIMLVDLGRNDVGRVSEIGSVQVTDQMVIERYSHVMHIVSEVQGRLANGKDAFDALRAAFPAGTLSGAPKVRAMEIIDELEPTRRGPYGGAVGYIGYTGNLDLCIAIRSLLAQGERFHVQAGAGIVADSVPEREFQESVNKAKAVLRALEMARDGFG